MGLTEIIEKILADARQSAAEITAAAEADAAKAGARYAAEAAAITRDIARKAEAEAQTRLRSARIAADIAVRNGVLEEKHRLLDEAFDAACGRFAALPDAEYAAIYAGILLRVVSTGEEAVLASENDKGRLGPAFVAAVNGMLEKAGRKAALTSGATREISAGLVVLSGGIRTDCSAGTVVRQAMDEMQQQLIQTLFG